MKDESLWWLFLTLLLESEALFFFPSNVCFHNFNLVLLNIQTVKLESKCEAYEPWKDTEITEVEISNELRDLGSLVHPQQKARFPPQKKNNTKTSMPCWPWHIISKVDKGAIAFDLPTISAKAGWVLA